MVQSVSIVRDDYLQLPAVEGTVKGTTITIGSAEWYSWLEQHRSFCFEAPHSNFTARKEKRPGGWYWYAYRRRQGKLRTVYLGRSAELTSERLNTIADLLRQSHYLAANTVPEPAPKHNLPVQLTSLVGREQDVATATALLCRPEVRLLSMIGAGGVGKTRLAIETAAHLQDDFTDGIYFVTLAPLRDPDIVPSTIAQTLGLKESKNEPVMDLLRNYLRHKHLLLVLDNFEAVVAAAPLLGELLSACPRLKLLTTSREVLHLRVEQQFSVPPLALPVRKGPSSIESLIQYAAVDLFVQRARAVQHDFYVDEMNARVIVEICSRLDGLPLAIELAAARIKFLSPQALLTRLNHRLKVLTGGARDLPERQQTLRNTIQWSYELLSADEQRLFRLLAVFAGGCTLQAIEDISSALGDGNTAFPVLDGVASLIDKSLLRQMTEVDEKPRLVMLEMIREYALEGLIASGEAEPAHRAHAAYYLQFAEAAAKEISGGNQRAWLRRLEQEHDNMRAALNWFQEQLEQELFLQLALALNDFWSHSIHLSEGRRFLEQGLVNKDAVRVSTRAKALCAAGSLAEDQHDRGRAVVLCQESLELFRALGDRQGIAASLRIVAHAALMRGDMKAAGVMFAEALAISRESGDDRDICYALMTVGSHAYYGSEYAKAQVALEECLSRCRKSRATGGIGYALFFLSGVAYAQGDDAAARVQAEESLATFKEANIQAGIAEMSILLAQIVSSQGDHSTARILAEEGLAIAKELEGVRHIVEGLCSLGLVAFHQGNHTEAYTSYEEGIRVLEASERQDDWNRLLMAICLSGLGSVVAAQGKSAWAARLWGTAQTLPSDPTTLSRRIERDHYERSMAIVRAQLGEDAFATALKEGRSMLPEKVLAVQDARFSPENFPPVLPPSSPQKKIAIPYSNNLTRREMDVLRLVVQGLTDTEIAERLVISPHTVHVHISSIYSKLAVKTRAAATRYFFEHDFA